MICGDGRRDLPYETCDDGNLINDDGCNNTCYSEEGFECLKKETSNLLSQPKELNES